MDQIQQRKLPRILWIFGTIIAVTLLLPIGLDRTEAPISTWNVNDNVLLAAAFGIDGKLLLTADQENKTMLWNTDTKTRLYAWRIPVESLITLSKISLPEEGKLAAIAEPFALTSWDIDTGQRKGVYDLPGLVTSLKLSETGNVAIIGLSTGNTVALDLTSGQILTQIKPLAAGAVDSVDLSVTPEAQKILLGYRNNLAILWSLNLNSIIYSLKHTSTVRNVAITPDGKYAITTTFAKINLWDLSTGNLLKSFAQNQGWFSFSIQPTVNTIKFSKDGKLLLTGYLNGDIILWSIPEGKQLKYWQVHKKQLFSSIDNAILDVSFDQNAQNILVACSDGMIYQWKL